MKYNPYSYSKIQTFESCAMKFKYQYIDKIKVDIDNKALRKGIMVHRMLEKNSYDIKFFNSNVIDDDYLEAKNIFENFKKNSKYYNKFKSKNEVDFSISQGFENTTSFFDKTSLIRGKIDYVYFDDDGVLNIVDFKTGKYRTLEEQSENQLKLYAIFIFLKNEKINEIKCSYDYVEHNKIETILFKREFLEEYKKTFNDYFNKIESTQEFKKNISPLCDWCNFKEHCKPSANENTNIIPKILTGLE